MPSTRLEDVMRWKTRERVIDLRVRGMIMGILNVTPDSFSDGGKFVDVAQATSHAIGMLQAGAEIIDIGGESTRPGSTPVDTDEELARVIPVIQGVRSTSRCLISVDTSKAAVAREAINAGADIVNDITGLRGDPEMPSVCAQAGVGVVAMHMQGQPRTMQQEPTYQNVVKEVKKFFEDRYRALTDAGIAAESICFDPGIGFGKTLEHNMALMRAIGELEVHGRPIMLGISRKRLIGQVLDLEDAENRDDGTLALTAIGRQLGARIHRVHDVKRNFEAIRMVEGVLDF